MFTLAYWTHDWSPFVPFLNYHEKFGVRWYGLAYALGFFGAAWLLRRYARAGRSLLKEENVWDFIFYIVVGVMLGGRLGSFLLYHPEDLLGNPLSFFKIWEGGMASHGGFAGVAVALVLFARRQKIPFLHLSDLIATTTSLGLMLGRIANFINGELWGKVSTVKWAVIFPQSAASDGELLPRHPSQLYEAGLEGALLLAYIQVRFWKSDVARLRPGQLAGEYLIGYALLRAIGEIFREPDATLVFNLLSRGTFYSIFLLLGGIAYVATARARAPLPVIKG